MDLPPLNLASSSGVGSFANPFDSRNSAGQGYRSSIINNYALGGSKLTADQSTSEMPKWIMWVAIGFLAVAAFVYYLKK